MPDQFAILTEGEFFPDPPPRGNPAARRGRKPSDDWNRVAEDLRDHPNQWRKVAENAPVNLATKIKGGEIAAFRRRDPLDVSFEAVARGTNPDTGRADIWARALA